MEPVDSKISRGSLRGGRLAEVAIAEAVAVDLGESPSAEQLENRTLLIAFYNTAKVGIDDLATLEDLEIFDVGELDSGGWRS
ncbi:hypothetical protein NKDENANG_02900 [Candidatus Entotheonellaceae bacterium PAL068K]